MSNSVIEQRQLLKDKKVSCEMLFLEIGMRNAEGEVPYTVIYELNYGDGETPAERVHIEGIQKIKCSFGFFWKVIGNGVRHSCLLPDEEEVHFEHSHE